MNVIELSEEHEANLRKLAAYLQGPLKEGVRFSMESFEDDYDAEHCYTIGCAVGHGPFATGITKEKGEFWDEYCERTFGISLNTHYEYYVWMFSGDWVEKDNTPEGAARRILWLLDKGLSDGMTHILKCGYLSHPHCVGISKGLITNE